MVKLVDTLGLSPSSHCGCVGSSPTLSTIKSRGGLEVVPAWSHKPNDVGSTPTPATNFLNIFKLFIYIIESRVAPTYEEFYMGHW